MNSASWIGNYFFFHTVVYPFSERHTPNLQVSLVTNLTLLNLLLPIQKQALSMWFPKYISDLTHLCAYRNTTIFLQGSKISFIYLFNFYFYFINSLHFPQFDQRLFFSKIQTYVISLLKIFQWAFIVYVSEIQKT